MSKQKSIENQKPRLEKNVGIRITDIKVVEFSQFELTKEFDRERNPLVDFLTKYAFRVISEKKQAGCLMTTKIRISETGEEFAKIIVEGIFDINPFDVVAKKIGNDNQYDLHNSVILNMANVVTATTRGILFEKLRGTPIQKEIFPLVDLVPLLFNNTSQER